MWEYPSFGDDAGATIGEPIVDEMKGAQESDEAKGTYQPERASVRFPAPHRIKRFGDRELGVLRKLSREGKTTLFTYVGWPLLADGALQMMLCFASGKSAQATCIDEEA
jgi:hypothetical protein